ncbi:hypothetical protein QM467_12855 [Rhodoblastus sp. 17X3]|uniref:hypothetical protein n=1 Tax=Rhodoblastus sp. 17X3 TaxID=3047026 RepID=UPI0024B6616C|nr:hypothetical protein [Rhodoblastus sp. 17X3]MDI9848946.1 hypothetical protein [Rhodoblastus sp. 17X3]
MQRLNALAKLAVIAAAASLGALHPAAAGMKVVDGQAYWTGDPGPVNPGAFYEGGQYKYDPRHYLSWYGSSPQDYKMMVHAAHSGNSRCVWRKRVINSNWEFHHPYIMVCD